MGNNHETTYLPSAPQKVVDETLTQRFADIVGVHRVETRQGEKKFVMTLGYTGTDDPTTSGEVSTEYHTLIVADYQHPQLEEVAQALIYPEALQPRARSFAVEFHNLLSHAFQLCDITPEVISALQTLFDDETIKTEADILRIMAYARETISGEWASQGLRDRQPFLEPSFRSRGDLRSALD